MHFNKSSQFVVPAPSTAARRDRELVPIQVIGPPARVRVVGPACVAGLLRLGKDLYGYQSSRASRRVERLIDREGDGSRKFAEYSSTETTSLHLLGMVFWNVKSGKHVIGRCRVGRGCARLRALPGRFTARSIACLRVCPHILGPASSLHALHKPRAAAAPASRCEVERVRPRCPNAAAAQACGDGALVVKTTRRACAVRRKHAAAQTAAPRRILRAGDAAAAARRVLQHVIEARRASLHFGALVASRPLRATPGNTFPQTDR